VPTNGKSAIELEQPPSASANSSAAANVSAFIFRSADVIRPEVLTSPSCTLQCVMLNFINCCGGAQTIVAQND
jgi:hypothetical protein